MDTMMISNLAPSKWMLDFQMGTAEKGCIPGGAVDEHAEAMRL